MIARNRGLRDYRRKQVEEKARVGEAAIQEQVVRWLREDYSSEQIVGHDRDEGIAGMSR